MTQKWVRCASTTQRYASTAQELAFLTPNDPVWLLGELPHLQGEPPMSPGWSSMAQVWMAPGVAYKTMVSIHGSRVSLNGSRVSIQRSKLNYNNFKVILQRVRLYGRLNVSVMFILSWWLQCQSWFWWHWCPTSNDIKWWPLSLIIVMM
jgi:hypothetical protein